MRSNQNNLKPALIALTILGTTPSAAADEQKTLECLQNNIPVEAVGFDKSAIAGRKITINVTNNTATPLGGVWVSYEIWAAERPLPLYSASIRPAATIAGGLLPGEAITAADYHFMEEREKNLAEASSGLTIKLLVENAADIAMAGFLPSPQMGSWSGNTTDAKCKPHDARITR